MARARVATLLPRMICMLAMGGVLSASFGGCTSTDGSATSHPATSHAAPPPVGPAHEAASALGRLATDPESLVAAGGSAKGQASRGVPSDSKVVVDEKSWLPDGVGGGVMTVTVTPPGLATVTYAAVMVHENGVWKVAATLPLTATATASGSAS